MESDALPYVLFLILVEFSLGAVIVMAAVALRGKTTPGFVRSTTLLVPFALGLALWVAFTLEGEAVSGYRLDSQPLDAVRALMVAITALSVLHVGVLYGKRQRTGLALSGVLTVLAVAVLALLAVMLRFPVWSVGLLFLSLLAGTLALGTAAVSLSLGHWYLVSPRLPAQPLNEATLVLLLILGAQVALLVVGVATSVDEIPAGGRDEALGANRAFWLRVGVGLAFPIVLAWMAWSSSRIRSMMSATGLLYLVTGAILAGEILARALLFDTGRAI